MAVLPLGLHFHSATWRDICTILRSTAWSEPTITEKHAKSSPGSGLRTTKSGLMKMKPLKAVGNQK
jgi:hypothetical protein